MRTVGRRADLRYTGEVSDKSGDYESFRDKDNKERLIAPSTGKEKGAAGAGRGFVNKKTAFAQGGAVASFSDLFKPKAKPVGPDDAPNLLTGAAANAAKAIRSRKQRLQDAEDEAVGLRPKPKALVTYAKGGRVDSTTPQEEIKPGRGRAGVERATNGDPKGERWVPRGSLRDNADGSVTDTSGSAGAGRGKKYAKGGMVCRGYGKARGG